MIYSVYIDGIFIKNCESIEEVHDVILSNSDANSIQIFSENYV